MKADAARLAASLLAEQRVGALGTLHEGAPSVTMTPFALQREPFALLVLVSGLASHTRDLLADPRVALMVSEPEPADAPVHALGRVSMQAVARPIAADDAGYATARASYEARFPDMRELFAFADFRLFALRPTAVRVVGGFAQAASITPEALAAALLARGAPNGA